MDNTSHLAYLTRRENIPTEIFGTAQEASKVVAKEIADTIRSKAAKNELCILGLATGSTPTTVYAELARMHSEENLSFQNVVTFNLDEYYPLHPHALQSYVRFMNEHLFDLVDIKKENIHIPDGTLSKSDVFEYCREYDEKISSYGGLDIQILGIGRTGHIGFNEPGSGESSPTRLITLDHITVVDAASDFYGEENVPRKAITMGVGTIMKAKRVILMAWGEGKSHIIRKAVEGPITDMVPATYLQNHPNTQFFLDQPASVELTRNKTPWVLGNFHWDKHSIKKAVIWLSQKIDKPILKLTNRDYSDNGMVDIITEFDSAYNTNLIVFNDLKNTITGYPGGKPGMSHEEHPERPDPQPKRVVLFSPHPDDDVISMGGTFMRLHDHGHDVHVAYQTSGNIAVFDDDVVRFADFVNDFHEEFGMKQDVTQMLFSKVKDQIQSKKAGKADTPEVQKIKGLIRRAEAKAGARYVGIPDANMHFLDMPFYDTGLVKKKPLGDDDIDIICDLLQKVKPHQVFAAGDLSDPHGTHRVCLNAIIAALKKLQNELWMKDCFVWLYRGAWQEWEIEDIDMAVPLSPDELLKKRRAIFKHQSQKDRPLFPGHDAREFWQRAEARNRHTADVYDQLGLPEYEALEAFKRYII